MLRRKGKIRRTSALVYLPASLKLTNQTSSSRKCISICWRRTRQASGLSWPTSRTSLIDLSSFTAQVCQTFHSQANFGTDSAILLAGKDRTGVLAAVILGLVGADADTINHDYCLTRIGTEPAREFLTKKLFKGRPIDLEDPLIRAYAQIP